MSGSGGKRKREDAEAHQPTKRTLNPETNESGTKIVEGNIVDTVNALPINEFISRYVPRNILELKIPISVPVPDQKTPQVEKVIESKTAKPDVEHKLTYSTSVYSSSDIPARYYDACFNLIYKTSYAAYKASSTGWSARKKRDEMRLDDMRYLLLLRDPLSDVPEEEPLHEANLHEQGKNNKRKSARVKRAAKEDVDADDEPLPLLGGFISFMTTYEDDIPVLYLYEIHIHPSLQNRGIGNTLMTAFEDIARKIGSLKKTMLTVFRSNEAGRRFYERLGYDVDEFSPEPRVLRGGVVRECDYLILSKEISKNARNCAV